MPTYHPPPLRPQWCPSAIYRPALQATLISLRDDLLVRYIGRPTVELKGVFSPADDRKERFNFALTNWTASEASV